jgi:flagellar basal body rod protein FlgG
MGKYKIDFANGCAREQYYTKGGNLRFNNYAIFTDSKGLKILTRNGVVFLTEENSEVL